MFKTILVPIDLGEAGLIGPALDKAVAFAETCSGTVRLIYVRPIVPVTYVEFMPPTFDEQQQDEAEKKLAELAAELDLPEERISTVVRIGSVYNEVLNEAEDIGADLILIESHRPSMATFLLGSNASTIVRHARCSVLVLRT